MLKVLIDKSLEYHANIIKSDFAEAGYDSFWKVTLGSLQSKIIPHKPKAKTDRYRYIARIAQLLLQNNIIEAYTSDALNIETYHQKLEKYVGKNFGDYNLLKNTSYKKIKTLNDFSFSIPEDDVIKKFRDHLENYSDDLYQEIRKSLPPKSSQDAWHLYTVLKWELDAFLVSDDILIGQIKSIKDKELRKKLLKIIMTPEDLCSIFSVFLMSDDEIISFAKNELKIDPFFLQ